MIELKGSELIQAIKKQGQIPKALQQLSDAIMRLEKVSESFNLVIGSPPGATQDEPEESFCALATEIRSAAHRVEGIVAYLANHQL